MWRYDKRYLKTHKKENMAYSRSKKSHVTQTEFHSN
jgi:hypothetical protein